MKGKIHLHPKANSNGFDKNPQNINKSGANRSLLKAAKSILFDQDQCLIMENAEILDADGNPTGKKVDVRIEKLTSDALALHYIHRAFESDKILIDLIDRIDGRPLNQNDVALRLEKERTDLTKVSLDLFTQEERDTLAELSKKLIIYD